MKKKEDSEISFYQNALESIYDMFFAPEIEKRKKKNPTEKFELKSAQVIFCPTENKPIININDEVFANITLEKVKSETGEFTERIKKFSLPKEFENCGHATLICFQGQVLHFSFDFLRNKGLVNTHVERANEFIKTAEFALKNELLNPFIDNSYSAMELLAKSELILMPATGLEEKATHKRIKSMYNLHAKVTTDDFEKLKRSTLNQLTELRNNSRYLKGNDRLDYDGEKILNTLRTFLSQIKKKVQ